jgi:spore coat polysaccharide biosynthesis protein SpsF (cytidylyltransferase family)
MLLRLNDETLIARAVRLAGEAFGAGNVVVAIPPRDVDGPLGAELQRIGALVEAPDVDEQDVLSRFWRVANKYRWHPASVIVRWTPDDPFKIPAMCRRVALGERLPVELGAEAFTLQMLYEAHHREAYFAHNGTEDRNPRREHITLALFPLDGPPHAGETQVTVDTPADWTAILEAL